MKIRSLLSVFFWRVTLIFLPIAAGLTLFCGVNYINEQQILRLGANEPQEWLAQDTVAKIASGSTVAQIATGTPIAIETDSAPYIDLYDSTGKPVAGTGYLHGWLPQIPIGVFAAALSTARNDQHNNFVTWQPEPGVREAIVIDPIPGGFVVAGRSLAYVEWEESRLTVRTFLGWFGTMLGTLTIVILAVLITIKREYHSSHTKNS
jgi:hypothetical protein